MKKTAAIMLTLAGSLLAGSSFAYDGTNCSEPGVCWEPKPGYPEKVAGSKYDPKHDPKELQKQSTSITEMEKRNAQRVAYAKKHGKFVYDVDDME